MLCLPSVQRSGCRALAKTGSPNNEHTNTRTHEHELTKVKPKKRAGDAVIPWQESGGYEGGPQAHPRARLLAHAKGRTRGLAQGRGAGGGGGVPRCQQIPGASRASACRESGNEGALFWGFFQASGGTFPSCEALAALLPCCRACGCSWHFPLEAWPTRQLLRLVVPSACQTHPRVAARLRFGA